MDRSDEESAGWVLDLRGRIDELVNEYRSSLHDCLDGLTEDEARLRLVPSKTTLLGLVKHVDYVEGVWFDQAATGRTSIEAGIASTPDQSFTITASDTIASVQAFLPASMRGLTADDGRSRTRHACQRSR